VFNAIVFDWDGTLVSCEEKIDLAIAKLCSQFPKITKQYKALIAKKKPSPGWIRKGFIASLPEDYLSYHFGIVAGLLTKTEGLAIDSAWSAILSIFRESYLEARSKMLANLEKLYELSQCATLYVVSNSEVGNIKLESKALGIKRGSISFLGNAKKYDVAGLEPSILDIPANRPKYHEVLNRIKEKHESVIVVGDNFSLDLVVPIAMGISIAYVPNPLTPKFVVRYIRKNRITFGAINDILDILITKKGVIS